MYFIGEQVRMEISGVGGVSISNIIPCLTKNIARLDLGRLGACNSVDVDRDQAWWGV